MQKFWELYEKSAVVSGFIAGAMVLTGCYSVVAGLALPEWFSLAFGIIIGFFFSDKAQKAQINSKKGV